MSLFEYPSSSRADDILFWLAIDVSNTKKNANWDEYDIDEHLKSLVKYLSKLEKEQLISFEKTLQEKLAQLYTAEIAELSIILEGDFSKDKNGYNFDAALSEDGFIYFRCWLILKGKAFFDDIRSDIQSFVSGKYSFDIGNTWAEGLLYLTDEAYSIRHGDEDGTPIRDAVYEMYPEYHYDGGDFSMNRAPQSGVELQKMYPQLVQDICEIRV